MFAVIVSSLLVFVFLMGAAVVLNLLLAKLGVKVPEFVQVIAVVLVVLFVVFRHHLGFDF